jgi:hypothetical protein
VRAMVRLAQVGAERAFARPRQGQLNCQAPLPLNRRGATRAPRRGPEGRRKAARRRRGRRSTPGACGRSGRGGSHRWRLGRGGAEQGSTRCGQGSRVQDGRQWWVTGRDDDDAWCLDCSLVSIACVRLLGTFEVMALAGEAPLHAGPLTPDGVRRRAKGGPGAHATRCRGVGRSGVTLRPCDVAGMQPRPLRRGRAQGTWGAVRC